jgi:murein DD-endopeptidase MepM/ murein hydrolase activator NlpD
MRPRRLPCWLAILPSLIAVFVIPFTSYAHTLPPTETLPLDVNLSTVQLPPELDSAVQVALQTRQAGMLEGEEIAITSARIEDTWAFISVAARSKLPAENPYVGHGRTGGLVFATRSADGTWRAELQGTQAFDQILRNTSDLVVDSSVKQMLSTDVATSANVTSKVNYKFPWPSTTTWNWWTSWHPAPTNDGLDFGSTGTDLHLLASANGVVTYVCRGKVSVNVKVRHADGAILDYVHLDKNSVDSRIFEGATVRQGQVLGKLRPGTWTDWPCGYTAQSDNAAHVHWIVPIDRPFTVDGWTIKYPENIWMRDGQTKTPAFWSGASAMVSTNNPVYEVRIPLLRR